MFRIRGTDKSGIVSHNFDYSTPTSGKNEGSGREAARPLGCAERDLVDPIEKDLCHVILFQYVFQLRNTLRQYCSRN